MRNCLRNVFFAVFILSGLCAATIVLYYIAKVLYEITMPPGYVQSLKNKEQALWGFVREINNGAGNEDERRLCLIKHARGHSKRPELVTLQGLSQDANADEQRETSEAVYSLAMWVATLTHETAGVGKLAIYSMAPNKQKEIRDRLFV